MSIDKLAIARFMAKDEAAALYVYKKTAPLLKRIAFDITHNDPDAEDAMLTAYEKVLSSQARFSSSSQFVAYLAKAAKNAALDLAKARVKPNENDDAESLASSLESIDDDALFLAMKRLLSEEDYELVVLHLCDNLTFPIIASMQGGTPSSCRGRYFRALRKLKANIKEDDFR